MSTRLNAPTYQNVNRMRSGLDMAVGFPGAEHVALAAEGPDQFRGMVLIDLPAKALNVDLNQVGKGIEGLVPNMFRDLRPAYHPVNVPGEIVEQGIFLSSKLNGAV